MFPSTLCLLDIMPEITLIVLVELTLSLIKGSENMQKILSMILFSFVVSNYKDSNQFSVHITADAAVMGIIFSVLDALKSARETWK